VLRVAERRARQAAGVVVLAVLGLLLVLCVAATLVPGLAALVVARACDLVFRLAELRAALPARVEGPPHA
jgi:hypothetical protein